MKDNIIFMITESDFNNIFNSYYPEVTTDERERIKSLFIKAHDIEWENEIKEFIEYELNN